MSAEILGDANGVGRAFRPAPFLLALLVFLLIALTWQRAVSTVFDSFAVVTLEDQYAFPELVELRHAGELKRFVGRKYGRAHCRVLEISEASGTKVHCRWVLRSEQELRSLSASIARPDVVMVAFASKNRPTLTFTQRSVAIPIGNGLDQFAFGGMLSVILAALAAIASRGWSLAQERIGAKSAFSSGLVWVLVLGPFLGLWIGVGAGWLREAGEAASMSRVLQGVVSAPLAEELLYRVAFICILARYSPTWLAVAASALLFTIGHESFTDAFLYYFIVGVALGWLWVRHRSLIACVVVHASLNSSVLLPFLPFL